MVRKPALAGRWYPGTSGELQQELKRLVPWAEKPQKVIGLVAPHAGIVYSGPCAGKGYGRIRLEGPVIILGFCHRGSPHALAVDGSDSWETPLGNLQVDHDLRFQLVGKAAGFEVDTESGKTENSLELQVPFIQYINPRATILPLMINAHDEQDLLAAGSAIGELLRDRPEVTLVASTDMSHYVSAEQARRQDKPAIDRMLAIDPAGLLHTVLRNEITMCGVAPTVAMLQAAKTAGATRAEVVEYTNSGAVTGDDSEVVAYLSLIVY